MKCERNEMMAYQAEWNADSLDGLTGLRAAMRTRGQRVWWENLKAWARRVAGQWVVVFLGFITGAVIGGAAVGYLMAMA